MNFQQEFKIKFGEKFSNLELKSVEVKKGEGGLIITFLYPSSDKELSPEEKKEITNWLKEKLNLEQLSLKVKFKRVFVEEKLILKEIINFFESKFKLVMTYLKEKNFKINVTPIDVVVEVELSLRLKNFFLENKISNQLEKHLKDNFLVNFVVKLNENENLIDEVDIKNVEIKATYNVKQRYDVEIVKEIAGKDISPRPEFLNKINSPKSSVIVAGVISKLEHHEFIQKKGKYAGNSKAFYTFQIEDEKGKIDCIYFCPKYNVRNLDALEEGMFLLLLGDVNLNKLTGKLQLNIKKMALASKIEKEEKAKPKKHNFGNVVNIEKLTSLEQDSMFGQKQKYNNKIMDKTIVVFDIETTGLDVNSDEIIELGALKIERGNIMEKFSTFVKPSVEISAKISNLTGITNEMVEDAPMVEDVLKDFYDFTRGCVLCGHNIIKFDLPFIKRVGKEFGFNFDNEFIDTMNEARLARLRISHFNLASVLKVLGLKNEGAHRAFNDVFATAQVLLKLNEI